MPDSLIYILAVMFGFSILCTLRPMGKVVRLYTKGRSYEFSSDMQVFIYKEVVWGDCFIHSVDMYA